MFFDFYVNKHTALGFMRFYNKKTVICFILQGPTTTVTVVNLFKHAEFVSRHRQRNIQHNTHVC